MANETTPVISKTYEEMCEGMDCNGSIWINTNTYEHATKYYFKYIAEKTSIVKNSFYVKVRE